MFRLRLFQCIVRKKFMYDNVFLQNNTKFNPLHKCRCISNAGFAPIPDRSALNTKLNNEEQPTLKQNNLPEQEFLVRLKDDPDRFGTPQEKEVLDEGDIREEKYFTEQPSASQKLRTPQYAELIKKLIKQRKIKEAIDLVEVRMLKEDRVKPDNYIFNLLLGACGRVGYSKKAFMLYNQMKKRGLTVTGGTYTALFNACANSPWPTTDGLTRATELRNIMIEKGHEPNDTNYNAMIKAFGRCGDLTMAFTLADEMRSKRFRIKDHTINFLLQACITDKEAGFRHALLVWRNLVNKNIKPSIHTYNLMLRCIRDCGIGDVEVTQDVINKILNSSNNKIKVEGNLEGNKSKLLEDPHKQLPTVNGEETGTDVEVGINLSENSSDAANNATDSNTKVTIKNADINDLRPNLMARIPHLGNIISLSEVTKPEERLLLVGGSSGFLENMRQHNCTPDIKTFTQLLDSIPSTVAAEKDLMTAMRKLKIRPDIDFFNMLIKKRSMRFDFENAKEVLIQIKQQRYNPDLVTYGILALGCKTKEDCTELINELKAENYSLNAEILGGMLYQACHQNNFSYVLEVMETCLRENVQPNKKFIEHLDKFKKHWKQMLFSKKLSKSQEKNFGIFKARYNTWIRQVQVDESEDAHPWQQYRQETEGEGPKFKWKDGARFKARRTSLFKVKTSTIHRY